MGDTAGQVTLDENTVTFFEDDQGATSVSVRCQTGKAFINVPDLHDPDDNVIIKAGEEVEFRINHMGIKSIIGSGKEDIGIDFERTSSQYLDLDDADDDDFHLSGVDGFTIAYWIKPESIGSNMYTVTKWESVNGLRQYRCAILAAGTPWLVCSSDGTGSNSVTSAEVLVAGSWYFIINRLNLVDDKIRIRVYSDSAFLSQAESGFSVPVFESASKLLIGSLSSPPSDTFDGVMDSVAIWNDRVLTDDECDELWNNGEGFTYPETTTLQRADLVEWWDFGEASGNSRVGAHAGHEAIENGGSIATAAGVEGGDAADVRYGVVGKTNPGL